MRIGIFNSVFSQRENEELCNLYSAKIFSNLPFAEFLKEAFDFEILVLSKIALKKDLIDMFTHLKKVILLSDNTDIDIDYLNFMKIDCVKAENFEELKRILGGM